MIDFIRKHPDQDDPAIVFLRELGRAPDTDCYAKFLIYLRQSGASGEIMRAARRIWPEWERVRNTRPRQV